eukprot:9495309-Pyramimonas_sp.AAC.1
MKKSLSGTCITRMWAAGRRFLDHGGHGRPSAHHGDNSRSEGFHMYNLSRIPTGETHPQQGGVT